MNFLTKFLWQWQSRLKLNSDKLALKYTAISKLGEVGSSKDMEKLLPLLLDESQVIRNAAARSIRSIMVNVTFEQVDEFSRLIVNQFEDAKKLTDKISVIEAMKGLPINIREIALAPLVSESGEDLQYAIILSLEDTADLNILDDVLEASDTTDLVLRRIALQTWYTGLESHDLNEIVSYCSPRIHYLIRATYELQSDGNFLKNVLSHASRKELSTPKAYPDHIIRYMTELLGKWEYDPDAYRSLHAVMVPSYFTFDDTTDDKPYIIL